MSAPAIIRAADEERQRVHMPFAKNADEDVWTSLVVQIAVVGGARAGYRLASSGQAHRIALAKLHNLPIDEREVLIHGVLRENGVRFVGDRAPAAKARAIAALSQHPRVARGNRCVLVGEIEGANVPEKDATSLRRVLVSWAMPGFGPKSTSDWLNNHGLTDDLIAFDIRVCAVLERFLGEEYAQKRLGVFARYEAAEGKCRRFLAEPLGISLERVDKRLFVAATAQ